MSRALTVKNIYDSKPNLLPLSGVWKELIGDIEYGDTWLIWGREKNGKTTFALHLAKELSKKERVLYVSAEEKPSRLNMKNAMLRVGITRKDKVNFVDNISFDELSERLKSRGAPKIVLIDNLTMYKGKISSVGLSDFVKARPHITFIFLAHEDEKSEPFGALAKQIKIISSILLQVSGLTAFLGGRSISNTKSIVFNEDKANLCFNESITNENTTNPQEL